MSDQINCSEHAAALLRPAIPKEYFNTQECFVVAYLDAKNCTIGRPKVVAIGTVTGLSVHPRDIFRDAVRRNAVSVIVAHNHPSGSMDVSKEDEQLTKRLVDAGNLLGVHILDHIIVTRDAHTSLAEKGLITTLNEQWDNVTKGDR